MSNVSSKIASGVGELIHHGLAKLKKDGGGTMDYINLCCNTALCALQTVAPFVAKRPQAIVSGKDMAKMVNHDTILLAALLAVHMNGEMKVLEEDGEQGVFECETNFDFDVLHKALQDWEKLTGKDPAEVFDPWMLKAIEQRMAMPLDRVNAPSSHSVN